MFENRLSDSKNCPNVMKRSGKGLEKGSAKVKIKLEISRGLPILEV